ncbi:MAG: AmmeMemoRadiSam system radical SAM enzyme [Ignavibacteria bacterium]|nr:AmmeMemoRadiSam system radical SAM enzyme [Ignavibacteria bacterium]
MKDGTVIYHKASWQLLQPDGRIKCRLCPRFCILAEGQHGYCFIRKHVEGELVSLGYGYPAGFGLDPIEKKPLYHFHPGSKILSFGTIGCNLGCKYCQNWSLSRTKTLNEPLQFISPQEIIRLTQQYKTQAIAFTYNEPIIFGEYVADVAMLARAASIHTVMVSNGYITPDARETVFANIDAANIDLKAFDENFYRKYTASHSKPVLDTLIWIKNRTNVWLEITNLIIPGLNDKLSQIRDMCKWIVNELGCDTPVHFSAFHPSYKIQSTPPTPVQTICDAREIALSEGIRYCYTGNIADDSGSSTFCPACRQPIIRRGWQSVESNLVTNGTCPICRTVIPGRF